MSQVRLVLPPDRVAATATGEEVTAGRTLPTPATAPSAVVACGALAGLAVLKTVMLAGLFTRTSPHPPAQLAPLFGASLALTILALALIAARSRWFLAPVIPVILVSLLSFGPQKLYPGEGHFFAQSAAVSVYPAIVAGSMLIAVLAVSSRTLYRAFAREVMS